MTGEIVFQKDNFSGNQIDLSFLKKGVYFLKVEQDYHKIIKL